MARSGARGLDGGGGPHTPILRGKRLAVGGGGPAARWKREKFEASVLVRASVPSISGNLAPVGTVHNVRHRCLDLPGTVEALKGVARKLNKTDWDFSVDPCSGSGNWANVTGSLNSNAKFSSNVTCDCSINNHTECHVISLELMRQNLTGVLPDEVVNLTYLQYLDLSRNFIQGPIPASWADLPVFNLSLQGNRISGTLPKELGRMPKLKSIQLEGNQLAGSIPPELGNIISLQRLRVALNLFQADKHDRFSC